MKIILTLLALTCISCHLREKPSINPIESMYCYSVDNFLSTRNSDSLEYLFCKFNNLYGEPCFQKEISGVEYFRLVIYTPRDYTHIFRISREKECDVLTQKTIPPNLYSDYTFFAKNRMVSYKMYEFPVDKSVFDRIKTEISNLRPVQEFDGIVPDKYKSYTLEYYHENRYMVNDTSDVFKGMDMAPIEKILMEYMPKDDGEALYGRLRRRPGEF